MAKGLHAPSAFIQRPIFFIERIGEQTLSTENTTSSDEPFVANNAFYEKTTLDNNTQQRQDDVTQKLMQHLHWNNNFFTEFYVDEENQAKQFYAYRQSLACSVSLKYLISRQFRIPLAMLNKIKMQEFTPENMRRLWTFIHALRFKKNITIDQVMLSHQHDQPRDILLRDNPYFQRYQHELSPFLDTVPTQHRLFLFLSIEENDFPAEKFCLIADLQENITEFQFSDCYIVPLEKTERELLLQNVLQQASTFPLKSGLERLDAAPETLFKHWIKNSNRFLRLRHPLTQKIGTLIKRYSNAQLKRRILPHYLKNISEELMQLLELYRAAIHWLHERQHVSSRAANVWDLYAWILKRFSHCFYNLLHLSYSTHSYESYKAMTEIQQLMAII